MCLSVGGYRHVVPCLDTGRIIKLESGHVKVRNYLLMEAEKQSLNTNLFFVLFVHLLICFLIYENKNPQGI